MLPPEGDEGESDRPVAEKPDISIARAGTTACRGYCSVGCARHPHSIHLSLMDAYGAPISERVTFDSRPASAGVQISILPAISIASSTSIPGVFDRTLDLRVTGQQQGGSKVAGLPTNKCCFGPPPVSCGKPKLADAHPQVNVKVSSALFPPRSLTLTLATASPL